MRLSWKPAAMAVAQMAVVTSGLWLAGICQGAGKAERCVDAQLQVVRGLEKKLDGIADIADESAARLVAGGNIYLAGEKGIISELQGRAGGLCAAKPLPLDKPLPEIGAHDIILLSDYGTPGRLRAALDKLAGTKGLVIVFASDEQPALGQLPGENFRAVGVEIPLDSYVKRLASGKEVLPMASPALSIAEWTYVAELLGACRRRGKQLAVYLSINLDEGHRRYQRTQGMLFEPGMKPKAVPRTQYAREFLASVGQSLEAVRKGEMDHIRTAARWIDEAIRARRKIVRNNQGHLPPTEAGAPFDAPFFTGLTLLMGEPGQKWIEENLGAGDVYLFLGYQKNEDGMAAAASRRGVRTIFLTSTPPGAQQARDPLHLSINPHWPITDACLELPGYDVKACPLSGIMSMTIYDAICAEVLARR